MSHRLRAFVFSFQTKLVLALAAVILLAIFLSGAVFVVRTREERQEQALSRVAAASPAIYQQAFTVLTDDAPAEEPLARTLGGLATEQDVRILILAPQGEILFDTSDRLTGQALLVPESSFGDIQRGFIAWQPGDAFPEQDVTFVSASSRFVTGGGLELPFRIVLVVETDTIADAWLGVLPGLGLSALVAIPLATIAAIFLARQVAQPVRKLTAASEAMAYGDFSQRVEVDRDDELGILARSFTVMAERVGERDTQMRALLANVSHDLKTPMTSISGYAQSLTDGTAAAHDAARIGAIIRDESALVNSLLADLLYLGEIDAGQIITKHEDVSLDDLLSRCVRRIEPLARAKDVALTIESEPDALLHDVDAEKLERAFTNVLDNAAKFTPPGGDISVQTWRENGWAPPSIRCRIANSGSTIPTDDLPRVFDRFFRGDRTRRTAAGSGLGLAIARELIELNHGSIEARSDQDSVAFIVTFPET